MNIELPTIPAGVLVLLALTAVVLWFYYVYTGDVVPAWPALALLAIVVAQASYTFVTKSTAAAVEKATSPTFTVHENR